MDTGIRSKFSHFPVPQTCFYKKKVATKKQRAFKRTLKLMGSRFEITVIGDDSIITNNYIDTAVLEITRIEKLISSWDKNSQTSEINRNAGIQPVKVDAELFNLIERALGISKLTDGAFDISYASMDRIWKFDGSMKEMPSNEAIQHSVAKVGFENIIINNLSKENNIVGSNWSRTWEF